MGQITDWIGNFLIIIGLIFMLLGIIGVYRFKDFYSRILVSAKVDTVGFITILVGIMFRQGFSFFSWKTLIAVAFFIVTNPIGTHAMARSAYLSGYRIKKERE
ncbi:hypothetical protein GCM10008932_03960 [Alkalibacterium iburiense]|uniref:Cation:proton antiporter n=1 Tax=Alkalibacterium iburiense TaxID=290589 RepID=A0ABN0X4E7_9LACT